MFNASPKTLQRIAPKVERVLIVDANPYQAKLLGELCKELGSRQIMVAHRSDQAMMIQRFIRVKAITALRKG